ncbi:Glu/Leu/Phe/Val dehydrogenase dimerization domain-containing protein [Salinispora arenicola]|uniref:Glu/Leu/Phe/Val dehydrogenase dimerization domain-containing protein n=1 Tax=Salinispora arenicola TaxID=168697 RepID=UPI001691996C|nr:Glu/Leu/Phe/Val dehydrogenase dimerization domain-containing protein [Salinispora arenicola]NIL61182.1 Glu/Leu/Phe/Val dehydrogenase [Salinispora arenicola]
MNTVIEYRDPIEGFSGWLVYDGLDCRLAAGGCRVAPGLTPSLLAELARRMWLKERLLGINVDGAKCGIDYDPHAPGKAAAVRRFLAFLRPELMRRYSMGCDMGTRWEELESLARLEDIPSVKYAVRGAQELTEDDFTARLALLGQRVDDLTLGNRRAGHALAQAALVAADAAGLPGPLVGTLQGFGTLGRAAACTLARSGVRITAVADEYGCVASHDGLDVAGMLGGRPGTPVQQLAPDAVHLPSDSLFGLPTDLVLLAAGEDAVPVERARRPQAPVVVVGANCGLSPDSEQVLYDAGVLVVPDVVGGIGGSASMEALFGAPSCPSPAGVLAGVTDLMWQLVGHLVDESRRRKLPLRQVAYDVVSAAVVSPGDRPYGLSPYRTRALTVASTLARR